MNDTLLLGILIVLGALAFGLGIWIGLGYPGLYGRYENTGARAPRVSPFRQLLGVLGGRRGSSRSRRHERGRGPGTGRWSKR